MYTVLHRVVEFDSIKTYVQYCDKTWHDTTFMSHNVASLNVIVSEHKSLKT